MTKHPLIRRIATCITALTLATVISSCRKPKESTTQPGTASASQTKLRYNRVADLPSALYQSQADSPIHWQPWTRETLDLAKQGHRLLFVVIALPQQPSFVTVLRHLAENPDTVSAINSEYVPVLVDADAARELCLLTPELCMEVKTSLRLPLLVWMTFEGNPVSWTPVLSDARRDVLELFSSSHLMIQQMWAEDPDYVLRNSTSNNDNRRTRILERRGKIKFSDAPETDLIEALRKITNLYDTTSRNMDGTGGMFPYGVLELLSVAARQPSLPADLRARCAQVTRELLTDLLPSAMFDPLDGGVFSTRKGNSWILPTFQRDCMGQARTLGALVEAWHTTADPLTLERARGILRFAENNHRTQEGLFTIGMQDPGSEELWMWTKEEMEKILPPTQAAWWIREAGIKGLGNLPYDVDPQRTFFRANSLALAKTHDQYAHAYPAGPEAFVTEFEASRKILLDHRNKRFSSDFKDNSPHAGATFRMISAYSAMFTATGDEAFRTQAVELAQRARTAFSKGRFLNAMQGEVPASVGMGRAFLYALALNATLDLVAITNDSEWIDWAEDLATLAAEQFIGERVLTECPQTARILDLPIADTVMIFDESTAGLFSLAESRLAAMGRPMVRTFRDLAIPLPSYVTFRPIVHTDLLLATLMRHYPLQVIHAEKPPASLADAMSRLSLRGVLRSTSPSTPAGTVTVTWAADQEKSVSSGDELNAAIREITR